MSKDTISRRACAPYRAWNRLEPRARKEDFARSLECGIHDPLWMLTRQWQFGEFKGEDTGSAILAKTLLRSTRLGRYRLGANGEPVDYTDEVPLEPLVERQPRPRDLRKAVRAGRHWGALLTGAVEGFNVGRPASQQINLAALQSNLLKRYGFSAPVEPAGTAAAPDALTDIRRVRELTNHRARQFLATIAGRELDGLALYDDFVADERRLLNFASAVIQRNLLRTTGRQLREWVEAKGWAGDERPGAWRASQLEYQFATALPDPAGTTTVLAAEEHHQGDLDWYSFDLGEEAGNERLRQIDPARRAAAVTTKAQTFIPTPASFPGMPNKRWWEFEDGAVDLGHFNAETTDMAKIVLSQYALLYGNDWFLLPYPIEVGSVSEVAGIIVTDTFGDRTFVAAARQGDTDDWQTWGLFNHASPAGAPTQRADTRMFLAPALARTLEGEAREEVLFFRDEMANLVWGIEARIDDRLGSYQDGAAAGAEFREKWQALQADFEQRTRELDPEAQLKYTLANDAPEHWIPFIPVRHDPDGDNRAIRLQRASMPRHYFGAYHQTRPRTNLLRSGLNADDTQHAPYFINEEEIPRAGIKVRANSQRARWYNGQTFNWYGYRKQTGRGEGSSGLRYDRVERIK